MPSPFESGDAVGEIEGTLQVAAALQIWLQPLPPTLPQNPSLWLRFTFFEGQKSAQHG